MGTRVVMLLIVSTALLGACSSPPSARPRDGAPVVVKSRPASEEETGASSRRPRRLSHRRAPRRHSARSASSPPAASTRAHHRSCRHRRRPMSSSRLMGPGRTCARAQAWRRQSSRPALRGHWSRFSAIQSRSRDARGARSAAATVKAGLSPSYARAEATAARHDPTTSPYKSPPCASNLVTAPGLSPTFGELGSLETWESQQETECHRSDCGWYLLGLLSQRAHW